MAVTRARHKVVLVTSMPIGDVSDWLSSGRFPNKPRDYLQAYLDYATRLSNGDVEIKTRFADRMGVRAEPAGGTGSGCHGDGFASAVAGFVRTLGYEPIATGDGDAFGLDFAVEDPRTGLFGIGIECDAPRHGLLERLERARSGVPAFLGRQFR